MLFVLAACEKEDAQPTIKTDATPATITSSAAELNTVITPEKLADNFSIEWSASDYGVATELNYTVEASAECSNFSKSVVLGSTTGNKLSISFESLNSKLINDLGLPQHVASNVSVRVTSKIKDQF